MTPDNLKVIRKKPDISSSRILEELQHGFGKPRKKIEISGGADVPGILDVIDARRRALHYNLQLDKEI